MQFNGGKSWGGILTVYPVRTTAGRLLIGVTDERGHKYCITIRRWMDERKAGAISPLPSP